MTETNELRHQMVETCRKMNSSGINQGAAGNLSVRNGDGFLITPSSLPYDTMTPDDIVEIDFPGTYAGRRPSSEWRFHRDILKERREIDVVLHCHSLYATTLACQHRTIPAFHYMIGVFGGTTMRCAKYATFGTQALSDYALEALKDRTACLLGQHGQISLGKTLESALWTGIEVETIARMYVQVLTLGEPPVLPDDEMARVIEQMRKMSYGHAPDAEGINDTARPRGRHWLGTAAIWCPMDNRVARGLDAIFRRHAWPEVVMNTVQTWRLSARSGAEHGRVSTARQLVEADRTRRGRDLILIWLREVARRCRSETQLSFARATRRHLLRAICPKRDSILRGPHYRARYMVTIRCLDSCLPPTGALSHRMRAAMAWLGADARMPDPSGGLLSRMCDQGTCRIRPAWANQGVGPTTDILYTVFDLRPLPTLGIRCSGERCRSRRFDAARH